MTLTENADGFVAHSGSKDRTLIYTSAFLRALGTGMLGVLLGITLAKSGLSVTATGGVIAAGLAGAACATLIATLTADRVGRRRFLMVLAALGIAGSLTAAFATNAWVLGAAACFGMLNGMGRDRGAALALEQAMLPATAGVADRTRALAWYNVLQDAGHAFGSLLAGLPVLLRAHAGMNELTSLRACIILYAGITTLTLLVIPALSSAVERPTGARRITLSPESRGILVRISALFAIDSLAGGFLTTSLLSFYFFQRFHASVAVIGLLFFCARVANALSHLAAAWLAKRIGLVNTMVFTHIPSSLLLATVAFAPTFPIAAALFLLREGLVEMDVPTRQSYVMAMVKPEERTIASGVTHLVRMGAWSVAPTFAGWLMQSTSMAVPLVIGSGMKIAYDILLYMAFRRAKPPEET